jgi:hypothetical protein
VSRQGPARLSKRDNWVPASLLAEATDSGRKVRQSVGMKKEGPRLPGLPTVAALMLSAMIAAWLGLLGPINLAAIEKWQTLVSASVAAVGIAVAAFIAVRNVSRQIRINILLREEDRIERQLPGLQDAFNWLTIFVFGGETAAHFLAELFDNEEMTQAETVEKALPQTDKATRDRVLLLLHLTWRAAARIKRIEDDTLRSREEFATIEQGRAVVKSLQETYEKAITSIAEEKNSLGEKISSLESRLTSIRSEIDAYFEDR